MMHEGKSSAAVLAAFVALVAVGNVVAGQLLSEPNYYYVDQSTGNEPQSDQIEQQYLALSNQLRSQADPLANIDSSSFVYPSPASEALIYEALQARLDEAQRQQRESAGESEKLNPQELIDFMNNIKHREQEDDGQRISPPVNNPLEFEAAAKLLDYLPLSSNNISSQSDLMSLDTLLSIYLNKLVADIEGKSASQADDDDDDTIVNNNIEPKSAKPTSAGTTAPASRYGSAEYIDHPLALVGHQYVQGGAGEGKQLLGPDGTFENVQVVKTDHAVPSYCDPPNPCPIGFSAQDGCLENFVNSASSSREYQAKQQCSCDNEHSLFNCASPISTLKDDLYSSSQAPKQQDEDNRIDQTQGRLETLARTIQNRFGSLSSIQKLISNTGDATPLMD